MKNKNGYDDNIESAIREVLDDFDFEAVRNTMEVLGWEWSIKTKNCESPINIVPSVKDIREKAYNLLKESIYTWSAMDNPIYHLLSGGLEAGVCHGRLELRFIAVESENIMLEDHGIVILKEK